MPAATERSEELPFNRIPTCWNVVPSRVTSTSIHSLVPLLLKVANAPVKTDAAAAAVTVWMTSAAKIPVPRPAEAPADDAPVDEVPDEPVEVAVESVPELAAHPARPRTPSPSIESTARRVGVGRGRCVVIAQRHPGSL